MEEVLGSQEDQGPLYDLVMLRLIPVMNKIEGLSTDRKELEMRCKNWRCVALHGFKKLNLTARWMI